MDHRARRLLEIVTISDCSEAPLLLQPKATVIDGIVNITSPAAARLVAKQDMLTVWRNLLNWCQRAVDGMEAAQAEAFLQSEEDAALQEEEEEMLRQLQEDPEATEEEFETASSAPKGQPSTSGSAGKHESSL